MRDVDVVLYATGYGFSFEFIDPEVITHGRITAQDEFDGMRIKNNWWLWQGIIPPKYEGIAFIGLLEILVSQACVPLALCCRAYLLRMFINTYLLPLLIIFKTNQQTSTHNGLSGAINCQSFYFALLSFPLIALKDKSLFSVITTTVNFKFATSPLSLLAVPPIPFPRPPRWTVRLPSSARQSRGLIKSTFILPSSPTSTG